MSLLPGSVLISLVDPSSEAIALDNSLIWSSSGETVSALVGDDTVASVS